MIFLYSLIIFALMFALGALAYSYRKSHVGNVSGTGDPLLDEEREDIKPRKAEKPSDVTYNKEFDVGEMDDESNHPKRH